MIRRVAILGEFLTRVASPALMAVVTAQLARAAIVEGMTLIGAVIAAVPLFRWKINSVWWRKANTSVPSERS